MLSPEVFEQVKWWVQLVIFAVGGAVGVLIAARNGWFKLQKDTAVMYQDALDAMETRVHDLETRVGSLEKTNQELRGEVEGKEAAQMLVRDILMKATDDYLDDILLIVCPVFNADGNEKMS